MKYKLRELFIKLFRAVGLEAFIFRARPECDYICIDKNVLEWCFNKEDENKLYYKAMELTSMEWSDNFFKQCRHYSLQKLLVKVLNNKITGDVVECGCWKGTSAYQVANILKKYNSNKEFHIFDSFEGGLSNKSSEDMNTRIHQTDNDVMIEKNIFISTEEEVKNNLSEFNFIKYYPGWIPEQFHCVDNKSFCFVHIDVDLYEPTMASLEYFYARLSTGGIIVVDDYGYTQFPGAKLSVDEFIKQKNDLLFIDSPIGGCFIIKQVD